MIKRIKYVSAASEPFSSAELDALLVKSRANNERDGITGALMMAGRIFFQILEGPEAAVDATITRIMKDGRHGSVQILRSGLVEDRRMFENWSMKVVEPANVPAMGNENVRTLMLGIETLQDSLRDLHSKLEQSVWTHFASASP